MAWWRRPSLSTSSTRRAWCRRSTVCFVPAASSTPRHRSCSRSTRLPSTSHGGPKPDIDGFSGCSPSWTAVSSPDRARRSSGRCVTSPEAFRPGAAGWSTDSTGSPCSPSAGSSTSTGCSSIIPERRTRHHACTSWGSRRRPLCQMPEVVAGYAGANARPVRERRARDGGHPLERREDPRHGVLRGVRGERPDIGHARSRHEQKRRPGPHEGHAEPPPVHQAPRLGWFAGEQLPSQLPTEAGCGTRAGPRSAGPRFARAPLARPGRRSYRSRRRAGSSREDGVQGIELTRSPVGGHRSRRPADARLQPRKDEPRPPVRRLAGARLCAHRRPRRRCRRPARAPAQTAAAVSPPRVKTAWASCACASAVGQAAGARAGSALLDRARAREHDAENADRRSRPSRPSPNVRDGGVHGPLRRARAER